MITLTYLAGRTAAPDWSGLWRGRGVTAVALTLLSLVTVTPSRADFTFAQFQETTTTPFTFTSSGAGASFNGTAQGTFTFLANGIPGAPVPANITLNATSVTTASAFGNSLAQPIDGANNTLTITRISDNANLLTTTFTGLLIGPKQGTTGILNGTTASGNVVSFTSSFMNFSGLTAEAAQITLDSITPTLSVNAGNGFLSNFTSVLTGSFTASASPEPVPEPGSVVLLGIGLSAAAVVIARKRFASRA